MADEVPVNPSVKSPPTGPRPRTGGGARPKKPRSARPGVTPANSPDPIPAVMRRPVAPSSVAQRTGAASGDPAERPPGIDAPATPPRPGDIGGRWAQPANRDDTDPLYTAPASDPFRASSEPAGAGRVGRITAIPTVAATRAMAAAMHQSNATAGSADHDHQTSTTEYGRAAATRQGDTAVPASFVGGAVTRNRDRSAPAIRPSDPAAWAEGTDPTTSNWAATAAAFDVDAAMTATHHDENAAAVAGLPEPVPSPGPDVPNNRPDVPNSREATAPADWPRNAKGRGTRQGGRVPPSRPATTRGAAPVPVQPGLMFQPFVRVRNMRASVAFFEFLGAEVVHGELTSDYVLMQVGTVQLGLVTGGPANAGDGPVELNFGSVMPLDELEARLRERRVTITEGVHDTDFGVRLHVRTPDGLLLRIGQLEPIGGRYADRRPSL